MKWVDGWSKKTERETHREDNGLELDFDRVTVLAGEHVHLALVEPELANVRLEEKDVGALIVCGLRVRGWVRHAHTGRWVGWVVR